MLELTKSSVLIGNGLLVNEKGENCLEVAQYLQTKLSFPFFESDLVFKDTGGISIN
jgi:hypothetical protein